MLHLYFSQVLRAVVASGLFNRYIIGK
jgi:hypothetical protein